jgi:hypothetical protein
VQLAAGSTNGSIFSFTYAYADLDDLRRAHQWRHLLLSQSFAGLSGNMKFLNSNASFGITGRRWTAPLWPA